MSTPVLDILIAARNEEAFLPLTLSSLQSQESAPPYRIIVVDNGSTDDTARIARESAVSVHSCPQRGKLPSLRAGFAYSTASIIAIADADTQYPKDWLCRIGHHFSRNPNAGLVFGPSYLGARPPGLLAATVTNSLIRFSLLIGVVCSAGFNLALDRRSLAQALSTVGNVAGSGWAIGTAVLRLSGRNAILYDPHLSVPKCPRRYRVEGLSHLWLTWLREWLRLAARRPMHLTEDKYYHF